MKLVLLFTALLFSVSSLGANVSRTVLFIGYSIDNYQEDKEKFESDKAEGKLLEAEIEKNEATLKEKEELVLDQIEARRLYFEVKIEALLDELSNDPRHSKEVYQKQIDELVVNSDALVDLYTLFTQKNFGLDFIDEGYQELRSDFSDIVDVDGGPELKPLLKSLSRLRLIKNPS